MKNNQHIENIKKYFLVLTSLIFLTISGYIGYTIGNIIYQNSEKEKIKKNQNLEYIESLSLYSTENIGNIYNFFLPINTEDSSGYMYFQSKDPEHVKTVMNFKEDFSSLKKMNINVNILQDFFLSIPAFEVKNMVEDREIIRSPVLSFLTESIPETIRIILINTEKQRQSILATLDTKAGKSLDKKDRDLILQLAEDLLTEEKAIQMGYVPSKKAIEKLILERELICDSLSQIVHPYPDELDLLIQQQEKKREQETKL